MAQHLLTQETAISIAGKKIIVREAVSKAPLITDSHRHVRTKRGATVELPCIAQAVPPPSYQWFRRLKRQSVPVPVVPSGRVSQYDGTLYIHQASTNDAGTYLCQTNNSMGMETTETELIVTDALHAVITPRVYRADLGGNVLLNCTVRGTPVHRVEWLHNQRPVHSQYAGSSSGTTAGIGAGGSGLHDPSGVSFIYSISNARQEHKGVYQCFAYNDDESTQASAILDITDEPPVLIETFEEITTSPGPSVSLKCIASGRPLPQVTWTLDGVAVPEDARYRIGDYVTRDSYVVSFVNISSVRAQDGGMYQCTARSDAGEAEHGQRLNVHGPPFVREMKNVSVLAAETMTLICPAGGWPIDSITWEKENIRLPYNHRQKVFTNGTLLVHDVERATDEGRYTCTAKNSQGQWQSNGVFIRVLVKPVLVPFSFPQSLHQGQRFNVLCTVSKGDSPIHIRWYKDEQRLSATEGVSILNVTEFSSTLIFNELQPHHKGNYTCEARNDAGVVRFTEQMVIHVPPSWRVEPHDTPVVKGTTAFLDCQADGFPQPKIRWTRAQGDDPAGDYKAIQSSSHSHVYENGTLIIQGAKSSDAGSYLCQAANGVSPVLSKVVRLSVHTAAHFRWKFRGETAQKGQPVRLKCEAFGDAPLVVTWTKDKQPFDPRNNPRCTANETHAEHSVVSEIIITDTDRRDSALFSCIARNAYGSDDTNIQLILQEPPDPPQDVKALDIKERKIRISWMAPYSGNSPIVKYIVQYRNHEENWHSRKNKNVSVSGSDTEAELVSLLPATMYVVRVLAINQIGSSEPGSDTHIKTHNEAPEGPPLNVRLEPVGPHSVRVSWKPPRKELQHGDLRGYYVGFKTRNSFEEFAYQTVELKDDQENELSLSGIEEAEGGSDIGIYFVNGLRRNTEYTIVVQAFNDKGSGPASPEMHVRTLEHDVPESPDFSVKATTKGSLTLSWPPVPQSTNFGYIVYYRKQKSGEWQKSLVPKNALSHTITGLDCGQKYFLYMRAENSPVRGEPKNLVSTSTSGVAPTAPEKQQLLSDANDTAIALNLASWREGGCVIESFHVAYKLATSLEWINVPREDLPPLPLALLPQQSSSHTGGTVSKTSSTSSATSVIVGNLLPSMPYLLLVRATNSAGTTEAQYDFVTSRQARDNPLSSTVGARRSPLLQLEVIIPVAASVLVVALVIGAICFVIKNNRDNMHPYDESCGSGFGVLRKNQTVVGGVGVGVGECVHLAEMDGCNKMELPGSQLLKKTSEGYYATPYATTRLAGLNLTSGVHNAMVSQHPGHPGHISHPAGIGVQVQPMCGGEQRKFPVPIGSSPDCFKQIVSEEESSYATVKRTPRQMRQSSEFNIYNYPAGTAGTVMGSPDEMSDLDSSTIGQWEGGQGCGVNNKFRAIQGLEHMVNHHGHPY
ncbi:Down syndrome cell adhesion molecule-like protein 1 homolog [Varroa jacobsoni]|uniref:Down syndrome cell adhesion molecule-like protein 1 homolog n=1 Tax=Varroa jacobsoni TaxID=62625 RepID=UPI000BF2924B|nr:Down syndrome cell adhesion molecule-like protein 1 homolog [Varroa jacobsoni]